MPKRYNNLYEKIINIDNIKLAHKFARKDKSFYTAVKRTDENLDVRVQQIQKMLKNHTYKVSKYRVSVLKDKRKERILYKLPYFPDRIIQWAIMLQLEPIFKEVFTDFTCASVPDRGIHYASKKLDKFLNNDPEGTKYCLKIDIKKFYPSINHEILKKMLRKKIKDKDLLIELDKIIDSMDNSCLDHLKISDDLQQIYSRKGYGLPIGSYLSQYLANYYLAYFDHWLKENMECKYVIRYMDDLVILHESKKFLHELLQKIRIYLREELDLDIKPNYQIFPVAKRGIDFVGYRHFYGYKLLRKSTIKQCKDIFSQCYKQQPFISEQLWSAYNSYDGWIKWCDGCHFYQSYMRDLVPVVNTYYHLHKQSKRKSIYYSYRTWSNKFYKKKIYYPKTCKYKHDKIHKERILYDYN